MKEILNKISENKIFKLSPIVLLHIGAKDLILKNGKILQKYQSYLQLTQINKKSKIINF